LLLVVEHHGGFTGDQCNVGTDRHSGFQLVRIHIQDAPDTGTEPSTATDFLSTRAFTPRSSDPPTATDFDSGAFEATATDFGRIAERTDAVTPPARPPLTPTAPPEDETAEVPPPPGAKAFEADDRTDTLDVHAPLATETMDMGAAALPLFPTRPHDPADDEPDPEDERPAPTPRRSRRDRAPRPSAADTVRGVLGRMRAWLNRRVDFAKVAAAVRDGFRERAELKQRQRIENKIDRGAAWWRRTVGEIAVLYAIVVPIELAVNGGRIGSFGFHPHPYWLIVLPMAGARGVVAGLLSAAVGSLLYFFGGVQALGSAELASLFTYRAMTEPILFFAVGYFAGELHDELELRRRKLERQLADLKERIQRLRQERDVLADANKELERRIVDDSVQFGNLIVAAQRIEQAGRGEVFELALELVEEHCGAASSVLLLLEDASLDLFCRRGWPEEEVGERLTAARASAYVRRAITEGVVVNGFESEEPPPAKGPLVVTPLYDAGGVVKALLCLDEVPATRLNETTITTFLGIGEWVSAALARLARGADAPAPRTQAIEPAPEADMYVGTVKALGERLRLELERCSRYGVPTSFLAIQATEWLDASGEGVGILDRYVLTHFTSGLRPSDGIYRFGYPACYLLVLPGTTIEGAEMVRTRLLRRVEFSPVTGIGNIEVFATGPDVEAPDLLSLAERVAGRFRRFSGLPLEGKCPIEVPDNARPGRLDEFLRRLRMEASLAVRNGFDLHVVSVSATGADLDDSGLLARHVHDAGKRTLRPTDGVYSIGPRHVAILLPCTDPAEAKTVAGRIVDAVRERDPSAPYGAIETDVLGLGASHPDAGSFLQALAKRQPS
jgi:GGDEF domain-containing protein